MMTSIGQRRKRAIAAPALAHRSRSTMSSPQAVSAIVARFDRLKQLTDRARRLHALNQRLLHHLPATLACHVSLATVRDGCLVLQADGAAWSSELRYRAPEILAALRADPEFAEVRSIRVRNVKEVSARSHPAAPAARLGPRAAEALASQAAATRDDALSAALRRLARHGRKD
jgi:hypothetical protein